MHNDPNEGVRNHKVQAGAELCQAQVKLEVIVDVVEEAWSCMLHSRGHSVLLRWVGGWVAGWVAGWLGMLRI